MHSSAVDVSDVIKATVEGHLNFGKFRVSFPKNLHSHVDVVMVIDVIISLLAIQNHRGRARHFRDAGHGKFFRTDRRPVSGQGSHHQREREEKENCSPTHQFHRRISG